MSEIDRDEAPADDALLEALGALAREQAAEGPALADLEALAGGEHDPADRAAFEALLAEDPEAAALLDRLAGPAPVDRFAEAARAALTAPPAESPEPAEPSEPVTPERGGARVLAFPRRAVFVGLGVALAAAAAAVFFLVRPATPPLPDFTASVSGGQHIVRGAGAAETPTLGPDDRLDIVLTPAVPVEGEVVVVGFVVEPDGAVRPWKAPTEISPDGAVRIAGTGRALGLIDDGPARAVTLRLLVGRPGADAPVDHATERPWQAFDIAVRLQP